MTIEDSFKNINKKKIVPLKDGKAYSVKELWDRVVKPLLLPKSVVEKWFEEVKKYVNDPNAVFFIRTGNTRPNGDAFKLRREFYTRYQNSDVSFVYDDNDIATYMYKLAYDGNWIPSAVELKSALINRTIPIKFTPSCKEEKARSAYVLTGKSPEIGKSGYKVSHIIDAGTDYDFGTFKLSMAGICSKYFQFGDYSDWVKCADGYYIRVFSGDIDSDALKFLKAHFLRLTCPLNYILTPKKDLQVNNIKIPKNDVGELKELQAYAMEQFKLIYGSVYIEYLSMLMIPSQPLIVNPGNKAIDVDYGFHIKSTTAKKLVSKKTVPIHKASTGKTGKSGSGIGQYAKNVFRSLLENGKLTSDMVLNLMDKDYCSREIGISYPVLVINSSGTFEKQRYYKDVVSGKYLICSQWYFRHKVRIDEWIIANNL